MKRLYLWRVMRLILLFMIAGLLHVSAATTAQTITLKGTNLSFRDVITAIQQQTDFEVYAFERLLKDTKPVTVDARELPLTAFLATILEGQPLEAKVEDKTIVLSRKSPAIIAGRSAPAASDASNLVLAYPEVRGRVVDSLGNPLEGASVRVLNAEGKRTTLQTTTDQDGYFLLRNVPEDASLEITYVGYVTQTIAALSDVGDIMLNVTSSELEEVEVMVSTGYQTLPKERATGSFATVSGDQLRERVTTNILDRIDGVASGVIFNRGVAGNSTADLNTRGLTIRGLSTLGEGDIAAPLIVMDNFPYHGDISNINPNDIEQITILKDAAAGSIWGAKAGNGVIVITTKKAKFNYKPQIHFQYNTHVFEKPDLYYVPQMPTSEYIDMEIDLFGKGYFDNVVRSTSSSASSAEISPVVTLLAAAREGTISESEAMQQIDRYRNYDIREDQLKYMYRNQVNQQYSLQLNGGSSRFNYYISGGYDNNLEGVQGNQRERISLMSRSEIKPTERLAIQFTLSYVNSMRNTFSSSRFMTTPSLRWPYMRLADDDGSPLPLPHVYSTRFIDGLEPQSYLDWAYRPLEELNLSDNRTTGNDVMAGTMLSYRILDGLSLSTRYQYQQYQTLNRNHSPVQSYSARSMINLYTKPGDTWGNSVVPYGGILDLSRSLMRSHQWRNQVNYHRRHGLAEITVLAGTEISDQRTVGDQYRTYGYNDELTTFTVVDLVNTYPTTTGGNTRIPTYQGIDDQTTRFVSFFANGSIQFMDRYIVTGSARRDASNLFGVETNNKWKPLWSVGGKWRLSVEDFYTISWMPELALRATYGHQGNVNNSIAAVTTLLYTSDNYGDFGLNGFPKASISNIPNPNLRWESVGTTNVAVDFAMKGNRINGSIEYYFKRSTDIIVSDPVDPTTGVGGYSDAAYRNAGELHTYGADLTLNSVNIKKAEFVWNSTLNASWNDNKVAKYDLVATSASSIINDGYFLRPIEGKRAYSIVSYPFAGLDPQTGAPLGYIDGQISDDYRRITGSGTRIEDLIYGGASRARFFGAVRNTLSWKSFGLSFNITYSLGHYFRMYALSASTLYQGGSVRNPTNTFYVQYLRRWQQPGDELHTFVPSLEYPADSRATFIAATEPYVENAGVVKLQYVNLAYTFESKEHKWLPLPSCRLFVNAADIGILWKATKERIDPDTRQQPLPRSLSFGLNISF